MGWLITKYLATAAVVVVVSEAAKRSDRLGGLLGALPLVTILALRIPPITTVASGLCTSELVSAGRGSPGKG